MVDKLVDPDTYRQYPHGKTTCECTLSPSDSRQEESALLTAAVMKAHEQKLTDAFKTKLMYEIEHPMNDSDRHYAYLNLESLSDAISRARDTVEAIKPCVSQASKSAGSAHHFRTHGVSLPFTDVNVKLHFNEPEDFEDLSKLVKKYNERIQ